MAYPDPVQVLGVVERILTLLDGAAPAPNVSVPDSRFDQYRATAASLLAAYKQALDDHTKWSLRQQLESVADCFDAMLREANEVATTPQQRAAINAALIRARMKRTHYSAYLAGAACARSNLEPQFKSWLLNIAASGAIALFDALRIVKEHTDPAVADILNEFQVGAEDDGFAFLREASRFHQRCWLTNYNTGRLCLASLDARVAEARVLDLVRRIEQPTSATPGWELQWHVDNWSCFKSPGDAEIWQSMSVGAFSYVKTHLEHMAELSDDMLRQRGTVFPTDPPGGAPVRRSATAAWPTSYSEAMVAWPEARCSRWGQPLTDEEA